MNGNGQLTEATVADLRREIAEYGERLDGLDGLLCGEGSVVVAGKTLTVDRTVHVSDLVNRITDLEGYLASFRVDDSGVTSITEDRIVYVGSGGTVESVDELTDWIAGTANQITVTDDGDGTVTLSLPQDIAATSSPTFAGLTVEGLLTANYIDMPELATPAVPDTDKIRLYAVADADFTVLETITDLGIVNRINQDTFRVARNTSGVSIAAAKAVYFSGSTGNKPNFSLALADFEATMPAIGLTKAPVADNAFGSVMIVGRITGVKTDFTAVSDQAPVTDWTEGDQLYVSSTVAGELTNERPTHPNIAQWIGTIEVVHATQGVILVATQAITGVESGTNRNTYTIGDTLAGSKTLAFDAVTDATLVWDETQFVFDKSVLFKMGSGGDPRMKWGKDTITWSANQKNAFSGLTDGVTAMLDITNSTNGGMSWRMYSKAAASSAYAQIIYLYNENDPSDQGAFHIKTFKHNGSGGLTAHGAAAHLFGFTNYTTNLFTLHGNGDFCHTADNAASKWGTGEDFGAWYDGTNGHLNPQLVGTGNLMLDAGRFVIPDGGYIGSASDTDAIAINNAGKVTFSQDIEATILSYFLAGIDAYGDVTVFSDSNYLKLGAGQDSGISEAGTALDIEFDLLNAGSRKLRIRENGTVRGYWNANGLTVNKTLGLMGDEAVANRLVYSDWDYTGTSACIGLSIDSNWTPSANNANTFAAGILIADLKGSKNIGSAIGLQFYSQFTNYTGTCADLDVLRPRIYLGGTTAGAITGDAAGIRLMVGRAGAQTMSVGGDAYQMVLEDYSAVLTPVTGTSYGIRQIGSTLLNVFDGEVRIAGDSIYTKWGAGYDAGIWYDGADMNIDPRLVGSGDIKVPNGSVWVAGDGGADHRVDFGAGQDSGIYDDGSDMVVDFDLLDAGDRKLIVQANSVAVGSWTDDLYGGHHLVVGTDTLVAPSAAYIGNANIGLVVRSSVDTGGTNNPHPEISFECEQSGTAHNIGIFNFVNTDLAGDEKRVAQFYCRTDGSTGHGQLLFRTMDHGTAYDSIVIRRNGVVEMAENELQILSDSAGVLKLGAGKDVGTYYATHWYFDSQLVGTGHFVFSNGNMGIHRIPVGDFDVLASGANHVQTYFVGGEEKDVLIYLYADEGDDDADKWAIQVYASGGFAIRSKATGAWADVVNIDTSGNVTIPSLAGVGSRTVVADANGVLSAP